MKEYSIKFEHTKVDTYIAVVRANSEEEAKALFNDSPFDYVESNEPEYTEGEKVKIVRIYEDELDEEELDEIL